MTVAERAPCVDWAWAGTALEGGVSGDLHVVVPFDGGALLGLVDGLGHGYDASVAAKAVAPVLEASPTLPVTELIRKCHDALNHTRGVVMSLASISAAAASMTWTGIGNVEAYLLRAEPSALPAADSLGLRPGVVGYQLPPLRATTVPIARGDLLVMATDGIRGGFTGAIARDAPPRAIASDILDRYAKGTDDAHVLVARFVGDA